MLESQFQARLIKELKTVFPDCVVLKNDANYLQGFPDLTVLHGDRWAVLEVKGSASAPLQPNQSYYIRTLARLSFSSIIYPENKRQVLRALTEFFAD